MNEKKTPCVRRSFIKESGLMIAGGAIGGAVAAKEVVEGTHPRPIKIAVLGCGKRARTLVEAALSIEGQPVRVVGLADFFSSQTQAFYRSLKGRHRDSIANNCVRAGGADCLEKLLHTDADAVYVTTPSVCRPEAFAKLIQAQKHVFLEKPLAADVPGVLSCLKTSERATKHGLTVHVGFQRRYDLCYQDVISKIHEGAIGTPLFGRAFCNVGALKKMTPKKNETEIEYQLRHWNHFQWTGGDFLVEQHVAGLDVIRWALRKLPVMAQGQSGWESALAENVSDGHAPEQDDRVFDHHSIEYEFDGGEILYSQCRRAAKAWNNTSEHLHGTAGRADLASGRIEHLDGSVLFQSEHRMSLKQATLAQQSEFLRSIRTKSAINQVQSAADSTLFALLGLAATRSKKRTRMDKMMSSSLV